MNPNKIIVIATASLVLTLTTPAADFGVGKLLGGKKAAELAAPTLAFKVAGAPTDKVEMIFFYGNATKTLITAANQKTDEVIKNLGEQLKVKVANLTARNRPRPLRKSLLAPSTSRRKPPLAMRGATSLPAICLR